MSSISDTSDQLFLLDNKVDLREHLEKIIAQAKKQVFIFSRELNPVFFDNKEIESVLSRAARLSSNSEVKIVVQNTQAVVDANHRLLKLSRKLPSKIAMQQLIIEPADDFSFVIVDRDKLWLQHNEEMDTGFANYDAAPEVKRFTLKFNDLWRNSKSDPRLRQIYL